MTLNSHITYYNNNIIIICIICDTTCINNIIMTKVIRCKNRVKLLGWNHCEKVPSGLWEVFLQSSDNIQLVPLPFPPFS